MKNNKVIIILLASAIAVLAVVGVIIKNNNKKNLPVATQLPVIQSQDPEREAIAKEREEVRAQYPGSELPLPEQSQTKMNGYQVAAFINLNIAEIEGAQTSCVFDPDSDRVALKVQYTVAADNDAVEVIGKNLDAGTDDAITKEIRGIFDDAKSKVADYGDKEYSCVLKLVNADSAVVAVIE